MEDSCNSRGSAQDCARPLEASRQVGVFSFSLHGVAGFVGCNEGLGYLAGEQFFRGLC